MNYYWQTYTEEQLLRIEQDAQKMLEPLTIARVIEVDFETFRMNLKDSGNPAFRAFYRGMALLEIEIHEKFLKSNNETALSSANAMAELRRYKGRITAQLYG